MLLTTPVHSHSTGAASKLRETVLKKPIQNAGHSGIASVKPAQPPTGNIILNVLSLRLCGHARKSLFKQTLPSTFCSFNAQSIFQKSKRQRRKTFLHHKHVPKMYFLRLCRNADPNPKPDLPDFHFSRPTHNSSALITNPTRAPSQTKSYCSDVVFDILLRYGDSLCFINLNYNCSLFLTRYEENPP